MYLRSLICNYVIPSDKNAEDILREQNFNDSR